MQNDRLHYLLQLYFSNTLTQEEKKELAAILDSLDDEPLRSELTFQWENDSFGEQLPSETSRRIVNDILNSNQQVVPVKSYNSVRRMYVRIASVAAILLVVLAVGFMFWDNHPDAKPAYAVVARPVTVPSDQPTSYIRNFVLPDGSTIVLKAGSTVKHPARFTGTTREIELQGEAYFDIAHDNTKPFIIHTGQVKTTVLGTAFNIKAWPGQKRVVVSVTRGRVKVEDGAKMLAVLTVNQEVVYNVAVADVKRNIVPAEKVVTDWTKEDMNFRGETLEHIAGVLEKRYGTNIDITDNKLAKTQIVVSFSGTEPLSNILDILCAINPDTHYAMHQKNITISNN